MKVYTITLRYTAEIDTDDVEDVFGIARDDLNFVPYHSDRTERIIDIDVDDVVES